MQIHKREREGRRMNFEQGIQYYTILRFSMKKNNSALLTNIFCAMVWGLKRNTRIYNIKYGYMISIDFNVYYDIAITASGREHKKSWQDEQVIIIIIASVIVIICESFDNLARGEEFHSLNDPTNQIGNYQPGIQIVKISIC